MMDFTCMMGICGLLMASALLMSYIMIGQFLILFVLKASFSVYVDVHPIYVLGYYCFIHSFNFTLLDV